MPFSARNRIRGTVRSVESEGLMGRVEIDAGDAGDLTAVITSESVDELGLSEGDEVEAVVKATSVMVDAGE